MEVREDTERPAQHLIRPTASPYLVLQDTARRLMLSSGALVDPNSRPRLLYASFFEKEKNLSQRQIFYHSDG